jgi:hypothetical protein
MKRKLTINLTLAAVGCICLLAGCDTKVDIAHKPTRPRPQEPKHAKGQPAIADIVRYQEATLDGITAGYIACRLGIPYSNYIADVKASYADWNTRYQSNP